MLPHQFPPLPTGRVHHQSGAPLVSEIAPAIIEACNLSVYLLLTGSYQIRSDAPVSYKGGITYNARKQRDVEADAHGNAIRHRR